MSLDCESISFISSNRSKRRRFERFEEVKISKYGGRSVGHESGGVEVTTSRWSSMTKPMYSSLQTFQNDVNTTSQVVEDPIRTALLSGVKAACLPRVMHHGYAQTAPTPWRLSTEF